LKTTADYANFVTIQSLLRQRGPSLP